MSACIITAEIFDAFLKCESKAYFKSSGQIEEPDELVNWQREVRQEFRRSCQSRYRAVITDAFDAPQPSFLDELKSGKHHILLDCRLEAGRLQSRIDAVENVTRLSRMRYRGYIPIRFVPNEKLSRHDKLLLAFDAYTLSLALNTTPTIGKIMHGKDQRTVTLNDEGVIRAESIRATDNFLRFGRIEFLLPELDSINKAAYWDYQRSRVYVKSNRRLRRLARLQRGPGKPARKPCPNKITKCEPVRPSICPKCEAGKIYKYGKLSKTVYDLKLGPTGVKRWIVKYYYPRFLCWRCKTTFLSHRAHWSRSKYGASFLAYLLYNIVDLTLSQSTVARIFSRFFGFDLGRGAINNLKARAAQSYKDTYERILANIVRGKLVHADETKVSLQGQIAFVWIFTNLEEVAYVYSDERSNETPKTVLSDFKGVLVSDFYAGYDSINCRQQKCLVHLMRDFNEDLLKQPFNEELRTLIQEFAALLRPMVQTVDRFGLKARFLRKHLRSVDRFYRELAERDFRSEAAHKYKKRFQRNRERLFTFLEFDGVPWNNNNAEHAVKALADLRHVVGGTSSAKGIREYLVLLSICQTCKYKGVDFLEFIRSGERDVDCTRKLSRPFLTVES